VKSRIGIWIRDADPQHSPQPKQLEEKKIHREKKSATYQAQFRLGRPSIYAFSLAFLPDRDSHLVDPAGLGELTHSDCVTFLPLPHLHTNTESLVIGRRITVYQRGQCILFSIVFSLYLSSPSHHSSVLLLPVISLLILICFCSNYTQFH
jgi:hypothetical protein